jgi:hypothetical protein
LRQQYPAGVITRPSQLQLAGIHRKWVLGGKVNISRFLTMRYLADKLANLFAKNATLRRQFDSHLYASDNHVLIDLADTGKEVDQADSLARVQDAENRNDREVAAAIGNGRAIGLPLA